MAGFNFLEAISFDDGAEDDLPPFPPLPPGPADAFSLDLVNRLAALKIDRTEEFNANLGAIGTRQIGGLPMGGVLVLAALAVAGFVWVRKHG